VNFQTFPQQQQQQLKESFEKRLFVDYQCHFWCAAFSPRGMKARGGN